MTVADFALWAMMGGTTATFARKSSNCEMRMQWLPERLQHYDCVFNKNRTQLRAAP